MIHPETPPPLHNGEPYCPYCTDGREPEPGEVLCGLPGCRDYPHESDDERDHAETMPGKAAAEDISYKFEE